MQKRAQSKSNTKPINDKVLNETVLNDVCDNMYRKRKTIYVVNFMRGIFFGIGSAIGGTVVVALILWVLSWFVNWPLVSDLIEAINRQ